MPSGFACAIAPTSVRIYPHDFLKSQKSKRESTKGTGMHVTVIIPALDEEAAIGEVVRAIPETWCRRSSWWITGVEMAQQGWLPPLEPE